MCHVTIEVPVYRHIDSELIGGITMYGALRKANLKPNDYVLIPGAGGGLGHLYVGRIVLSDDLLNKADDY